MSTCFKALALCALSLAAVATSGCATIIAGGPDVVLVNSSPDGAAVSLDGFPVGSTPCQVSINRGSEGVFEFEAPGYRKTRLDLDKSLNGWFLGNLILGGAIGIGIDLLSHNQGKYPEDPVFVQLAPATGSQ